MADNTETKNEPTPEEAVHNPDEEVSEFLGIKPGLYAVMFRKDEPIFPKSAEHFDKNSDFDEISALIASQEKKPPMIVFHDFDRFSRKCLGEAPLLDIFPVVKSSGLTVLLCFEYNYLLSKGLRELIDGIYIFGLPTRKEIKRLNSIYLTTPFDCSQILYEMKK